MPAQPAPRLRDVPLALLRRREFAFLVVGGINTAVGLAAFAGFYQLFGRQHYLAALSLAYGVAILIAFMLHRRLVFQVRGNFAVDLLRFTLVQAVGFGLNIVLLSVFVEVVGLPVLPAQVLALALTVVCSYFGHLLFSFRRPHT